MTELELLEIAAKKSVLLCGERITDVYNYVSPLGRPTKDAILSVQLEDVEEFDGGIEAVSYHLSDFCHSVEIHSGGHHTIKTRFVEQSHFHKLFQTYQVSHSWTGKVILPPLAAFDLVAVVDYGHGMADNDFLLNMQTASVVSYLAVNVQTNSGNYGYNLCTKYENAQYLCVDESEARLATQNRTGPIEESLDVLRDYGDKVVITLGKQGAIGMEGGEIYRCPAFTDSVVDTMGAGDAFFAITALVAEEARMPELLRIGNAAGALKSQIVGHRGSVTKEALIEYLRRQPL